jgi:nanoRNase/pAp phosphatase (c-di-AMP/oligoRNAs hydrolase)
VQSSADAVTAFVRQSPELAAGLVLLLAVLAIVGWRVVRYLRRPQAMRLRNVLAGYDSIGVLMHPNPDPDAMSAALAVQHLVVDFDTDVTIQYPGEIRHQENRAFETVLDLSFERIDGADELAGEATVLVDHNDPRGFQGASDIEPVAVIDHHPGDGTGTAFTDVREGYGACATIFAEYFDSLGWTPLDPETTPDDGGPGQGTIPAPVATGMLFGIQSDTTDLTKGCSSAEFRAAEFLYPGIDTDRLDRIANPEVDAEVLDIKAAAISNREVRNAFAISDVDTVSNVDAIPQAADELLTLEGVTAVVVLGEKDDTLHLSGRSRDDRVHMGKTLEHVVEDIPMSSAGGHARMGGGQLSVEHMEGIGPGEGVPRAEFIDTLFAAMTGDR